MSAPHTFVLLLSKIAKSSTQKKKQQQQLQQQNEILALQKNKSSP
jgi:hypothetical protein